MFTDQQSGIGRIGTPTHGSIEDFSVFETGQKGRNGFTYTDLGSVGIGIGRMLCV
jgi:hypothetical protein